MDSPSALFRYIGAPLHNERWSWGASNENFVVLRTWQDETKKYGDSLVVTIRYNWEILKDRPGFKERERHIEEIQNGKPAFMIMCKAVDPTADPRDIQSFNKKDLFVGGDIVDLGEGNLGIEAVKRITIKEFRSLYS